MSSAANWSYTAKATIWRKGAGGRDENGDPVFVYTVGCKLHCHEISRRSLYVKEETA